MKTKHFVAAVGLALLAAGPAASDPAASTRFLVVAPDRGFHGNQTIEERFAEYRDPYPTRACSS